MGTRFAAKLVGGCAWAAALSGCSLLIDLDHLDRGGPLANVAATDAGSGGGDGTARGDDGGGSIDSGPDAAAACQKETEPNEAITEASRLTKGANCGAIDPIGDVDVWAFTQVGTGSLTVQGTDNLHYDIRGPGTTASTDGSGPTTRTVSDGNWTITIFANDGMTGSYTITLE